MIPTDKSTIDGRSLAVLIIYSKQDSCFVIRELRCLALGYLTILLFEIRNWHKG